MENQQEKKDNSSIELEIITPQVTKLTTEVSENKDVVPNKEQLDSIEDKLNKIHSDFESKIKYDSAKEKIIDRLHNELQSHKDDLISSLLRPIFMDIIEVIDDTNRLLRHAEENDKLDDPVYILKQLRNIPTDLEDVLYRHGVEKSEEQKDDNFYPAIQKVIKTEMTDKPNLHRQVCAKLKDGFTYKERLFRHEFVSLYKYEETHKQNKEEE